MLTHALTLWGRTLRQRAVWSMLIWTVVFVLLLMVVLMVLGAGALASAFDHPSFSTPFTVAPHPGHLLGGIAAMYLVLLAAGPFVSAGVYGLYGQAVAGVRVTWRSFWTFGAQFYGRAWGLIAFLLIWTAALSLVSTVLVGFLHVIGVLLVGLGFVLSWPLVMRMMGGLFVDRLSWSASFRAMFQKRHYGGLLGGAVLMLVAYAVLILLAVGLMHAVAVLGFLLYFAMMLFLAVAGPVWVFALYRANGK